MRGGEGGKGRVRKGKKEFHVFNEASQILRSQLKQIDSGLKC